ncbi:MAG: hypothetical protein V4760_11890 [Bdellovibrionota bacterium]
MAQCPSCGTTLKEEYGMSQCSKCGVFSFIDMDGVAVIASADGDEATPVVATGGFEMPEAEPENDEQPTPLASDFGGEVLEIASEQDFAPAENPGEQEFQAFSFDPVPAANPVENAIPDLGPADDPLGLADFANSELSSAKDGPLLFRVFVSGIDSKEMRETIREVLEDPRFGWDADQMFAKLEKGVLTIERLSPVKASILVTRIKRLPVKIRWEQYAITQVDSTQ